MQAPVIHLNPRQLLTCGGPCGEDYEEWRLLLEKQAKSSGSDLRFMWAEGSFGTAVKPASLYKLILEGGVFTANEKEGVKQKTELPFVDSDEFPVLSIDNFLAKGSYNSVYKIDDSSVVRISQRLLTDDKSNVWFDNPEDIGVAALELMTALLGASLGISLPILEGCIFDQRLYMVMPRAVFKTPDKFTKDDVGDLYVRLDQLSKKMRMSHLDCKPENIAFFSNRLYLTDFGDMFMTVKTSLPPELNLYASILSFAVHMKPAQHKVQAALITLIKKAADAVNRQDKGVAKFNEQTSDNRFLAHYFERTALHYLRQYGVEPVFEQLTSYIENLLSYAEQLSLTLSQAVQEPIVVFEPDDSL